MLLKAILLNLLLHHSVFGYPDYYWRPYTNEIPEDAFNSAAGTSYLYIGRGPYGPDGALIGEILPGNDYVTAATNDALVVKISENVLILCTCNAVELTWVPATPSTILGIAGIVKGGYESQENLLLGIGRVAYKDSTRVGKVLAFEGLQDLRVGDLVDGYLVFDSYEVLVSQESRRLVCDAQGLDFC